MSVITDFVILCIPFSVFTSPYLSIIPTASILNVVVLWNIMLQKNSNASSLPSHFGEIETNRDVEACSRLHSQSVAGPEHRLSPLSSAKCARYLFTPFTRSCSRESLLPYMDLIPSASSLTAEAESVHSFSFLLCLPLSKCV